MPKGEFGSVLQTVLWSKLSNTSRGNRSQPAALPAAGVAAVAGAGAARGRLHRGCHEKRAMGILARAAESTEPPAAAPQSHPVPTTGSNSPALCGVCEEQQTRVPSSCCVCLPLLLGGISGCLLAMQRHLRGRPRPWGGRRHRLRAGMPRAAWLHARVCVHECMYACPHGAEQSGAFWRAVSKEVAAKIPIPAFSSAKVQEQGVGSTVDTEQHSSSWQQPPAPLVEAPPGSLLQLPVRSGRGKQHRCKPQPQAGHPCALTQLSLPVTGARTAPVPEDSP